MSTNFVEVVKVDWVKPHPDADRLEIVVIRGATCVVPKSQFTVGEQVVYFPPDMLIPEQVAEELGVVNYLKHATYPGDMLATKCRIGACRLRGQPSYGFVAKMDCMGLLDGPVNTGADVSEWFNAVKYTPAIRVRGEDTAAPFPAFHEYTDIEHFWRFPEVFSEGLIVRITEKIHGTNSRVGVFKVQSPVDGSFEWQYMAGSHHCNKKKPESGVSVYWEPLSYEPVLNALADLCDEKHNVILFGEIYGPGIQSMDYGLEKGTRGYRIFDISVDGKYLDWPEVKLICDKHGLDLVPTLYDGPFSREIVEQYTHGPTTMGKPNCDYKGREGVVITSYFESYYAPTGGRRIAKSVSADYLAWEGGVDQGEYQQVAA